MMSLSLQLLLLAYCIMDLAKGRLLNAAGQWIGAAVDSPDTLPILNVRLVPPKVPHKRIQAEIGLMDAKNADLVNELHELVAQAMNTSLADAEEKFKAIVAANMEALGQGGASFLQRSSPAEFAVKLNILPETQPGIKLLDKMIKLDKKSGNDMVTTFRQASTEFSALTSVMANEFQARIKETIAEIRASLQQHVRSGYGGGAAGSLLTTAERWLLGPSNGLPEKASVRVQAAEKWPMITEILQDWQRQRDKNEDLARARILELEQHFCEVCNGMMARILEDAVKKFMSNAFEKR